MTKRLLPLLLAAGVLVPPGASHAGVVECHLIGNAGEFAVRKIVNPSYREIQFHISRSGWNNQLKPSDRDNRHFFIGFWLLRANNFSGVAHAFFDYSTTLGLSGVNVTTSSVEVHQRLPGSNFVIDGDQGAWGYPHYLDPGTYYFIGFGDGDGSFDMYTRMSDAGSPTCEEMPEVTGRVVSYDALDFKGGSQIVGPGYGTVEDAKLSFTNPYRYTLGAVFAYQPPPLPPASLRVDTEFGSETYRQDIKMVRGTASQWNWTANYTGKTNTILIELLQTNLQPGM